MFLNQPVRNGRTSRLVILAIGFHFLNVCADFVQGAGLSAKVPDFVQDVQPILKQHCYACHGESKQSSGLRLDVREAAFRGGDGYGPSILAGEVDDSPIIQLITAESVDQRMPPGEEGLSANEIKTLIDWIRGGADWPLGVDLAELEDRLDHWSFKPLRSEYQHHSIDDFIVAQLDEVGLELAIETDAVSWLRRVTFDLTGLPPSPQEAVEFHRELERANCVEQREVVYREVVDRLLSSQAYGERWAQHWLDVVRYADTHGFEVNTERPNAWPYRDYVIQAFNSDTPYDQFVREQIVGDALEKDAATGFLVTASVLLPGQIGKDAASIRLARQDALDEIVNNISQTFFALSVGCARCHDHKFDPISARDYYALQAMVAGVEYEDREIPSEEAQSLPSQLELADSGQMVFAGKFRQPDTIFLLARGDPEQPREEVLPAVPSALGEVAVSRMDSEKERRRALAEWIASPEHPLTARVIVNRVWQGHFGLGLVATPSDFGRNGSAPSHPELLDWLSDRFIRSGWSLKQLHRWIVLSKTFRQSSAVDFRALEVDADGRWLWRYPSRRREAESIRDSMLAVSGRLDRTMYGPGFNLFDLRGGLSGFTPVESLNDENQRRMIYSHKVRREPEAVFGAFDCPDAGQSTALRRDTTTPIQALNLLNSRFTLETSAALADRVQSEVGSEVAAQIDRAYELTLGRLPLGEERDDAEPIVREHGLSVLCRALFNSNEFLFIP